MIAALAGLPPCAAVTVVVTLLLAALQVLTGAWLARAFAPAWIPRPERDSRPQPNQATAVNPDPL